MNSGTSISQRQFLSPQAPTQALIQSQGRSTASQLVTPLLRTPPQSDPNTEERNRRSLASALRERQRLEQQMLQRPVELEDFCVIDKSDLRRGDIVLTYEAEPSSLSHKQIQATQRHADLNNIDNNRGMAEIIHAGIILRDDVVKAEKNFRRLGPQDHPYLSERGGIGTTFALRAIGSAVPNGTGLVYRSINSTIAKNLVSDLRAKEGVQYSKMEYGTSLRRADFPLPDNLAERNSVSHILAVELDRHQTMWANEIKLDEVSDDKEIAYAQTDVDDVAAGRRKRGPGATCSTFIVKGLQAAVGKTLIDKMEPENPTVWQSRNNADLIAKAHTVYREQFPTGLRIDAKRISPKSLQHLLETLEQDRSKMFERVGRLQVKKMAYPERRFDELTGEEISRNTGACCFPWAKTS